MDSTCKMNEQQKANQREYQNHSPTGVDLVKAEIELFLGGTMRPSAVDIGVGRVDDPTSGTSVSVSPSPRVYMKLASPFGKLKIWRVAEGRFIFSTQESTPRYITAYAWMGKWFPVWLTGSDPVDVTEENMTQDNRVWQVIEKFSKYFIRLEKNKRLYLNAGEETLEIKDVGDDVNNTRNVTPLVVS